MHSQNKNAYAVILAGGSGTRFWPLSRHEEPKQFLKMIGESSLLQETLKRVQPLVSPRNVLIVSNHLYQHKIHKQLKEFGVLKENILLEPEGKNTAPAIAWAAFRISRLNPESVMMVLPSDHMITQSQNFLKNLREAIDLAEKRYLVTLGIVPTRPETGYGYLKIKERKIGSRKIQWVEEFVEKPSLPKAQKFLKERKYLWNSGMFVWKTAVILEAFHRLLPEVYHLLKSNHDDRSIPKVWKKLPSVSIDYGILEKSHDVVTVPASNIGWSDLGSWEALAEIFASNEQGNILRGDVLEIDCKNTFVFGHKRLIATVGLNDLVVVDTPDALLICQKKQSQKIKDIVGLLKQQNRPQWLRYTA